MADRRDDERRFRGERRDPETDQRIDRRADRYRGSDERGYGGGERLGRDWERGDMRGAERSSRDEHIRSVDEERFLRDRDVRGSQEMPRDRDERRLRARDNDDVGQRRASPSGAFYEELREERTRGFDEQHEHDERGHYNLAGLHDLDDLSELRERYRERRSQRDYEPRYGHGPGVENMEAPRLGYGTSMSRRDTDDAEMGHGRMLGGNYRTGAARPMGRGPKGYQRSDDRIREDICDRLMTSPYDASDVEITVSQGEVTLTGTVRSRADKWGIEDMADAVLGVQDVHNQIRVNRGEAQASSTTLPGDTGSLHS
jgi:hypothetical protein